MKNRCSCGSEKPYRRAFACAACWSKVKDAAKYAFRAPKANGRLNNQQSLRIK